MRVLERGAYRGPHLYSHLPMIRFQLDLGRLEEFPTDKLPQFTERLLALMPTLQDHGCSYKQVGGFVRRLRDRSEEHTSELQSRQYLGCRLLLEKNNNTQQ